MVTIVALKNPQARQFYAQQAAQDSWSVRELTHQIERKAFERTEIASTQAPTLAATPLQVFKDPYFLDFLGLRQGGHAAMAGHHHLGLEPLQCGKGLNPSLGFADRVQAQNAVHIHHIAREHHTALRQPDHAVTRRVPAAPVGHLQRHAAPLECGVGLG